MIHTEVITRHLEAATVASKTPGLQYVAVDASGIVFEYGGGLADLHRQTVVDSRTTMMAYSMSKTVTAVAALQLVEAGRIGLEDPVAQYVDDIPYGTGVTVRQLLCHTSGIPNPIPLRWVHAAAQHADFDEDAARREVLRTHPRLASPSGTKYRYSNIGYWLLGSVIERASQRPFTDYVNEHILRPLHLTPADMGYVVTDPARHATGYLEKYSLFNLVKGLLIDRQMIGRYDGPWLEIRSHYLNGPAFGGLVGTATGFARFLQDQLQTRSVLIGDAARHHLYDAQQTTAGTVLRMTLGWHIGKNNGLRCFYKEGGGGGFHCLMRLYPDRGIGTVVMANATAFNVHQLLDTTDGFFLT